MKYKVTILTQNGDQFTESFETIVGGADGDDALATALLDAFANQILSVGHIRHFDDGSGEALSHNEIRRVRWEKDA
jgi:hypothetical protein